MGIHAEDGREDTGARGNNPCSTEFRLKSIPPDPNLARYSSFELHQWCVLSPLAEITNVMSRENYVTSSTILPIINLLIRSVLNEKDKDVPLTNDLRDAILGDLLGRKNDDDVIHLLEVASFLDPRFRFNLWRMIMLMLWKKLCIYWYCCTSLCNP